MSESGLKTVPITNKIPKYGYPINEHMISLDDGRLLATLHIKGVPFECESPASINMAFNAVRAYFNQVGQRCGNNLGVWTHIIKKEDKLNVQYHFENSFMAEFSAQYLDTFKGQRFFTTDYYVSLVFKYSDDIDTGIRDLYELINIAQSTLKAFSITLLGITEEEGAIRCHNIEFLSYLMNHSENRIPLTKNKVVDLIGDSDWHFGYDLLELRNTNSDTSHYATFFELDGYPQTTFNGMWDFILSRPYEFVLTQSMIFMKSAQAVKLIDSQINLISSSDHTAEELRELEIGRDQAAIGNITFGDYHCSLAVYSNTPEGALKDGTDFMGDFLGRNVVFKRSNLKSPFSFRSALPASKDRMLPSPKTATNLACSLSLHNYSQGKKDGNPIGDGQAIMPLKTISDTLFYFNCHASPPHQNVLGQALAGHTLILGASGAGKTTLEGTIVGFLTRFNPQIFCIDYNRSTELYIRVYGGEYFTFQEGIDTGLNPYQLDDSPELRSFLLRLTCRLAAESDGSYTMEEEEEIKQAIDAMMNLYTYPFDRGLAPLLDSIQDERLRTKLSKWCRDGGQFGWCLDSPRNRFNPNEMDKIGFDTTILIKKDALGFKPYSEPILGVLFFLKSLMQKEGRLFCTIVEEFWMPANYPLTQSVMADTLKAGRLKYEFMILSSQSPEDAINCAIFAAIMQQTATKIYLPNPEAEFEQYKRCNVTESEFKKIQALDKASRTFLIKQSNTSCFAKLDLAGFTRFLPIISTTAKTLSLCDELRKEFGDDVNKWLPVFMERYRYHSE